MRCRQGQLSEVLDYGSYHFTTTVSPEFNHMDLDGARGKPVAVDDSDLERRGGEPPWQHDELPSTSMKLRNECVRERERVRARAHARETKRQ